MCQWNTSGWRHQDIISELFCLSFSSAFLSANIPHSAIAKSGNIEMGLVHQSISLHLSIYLHAFLHDGWMDFLHSWYHDQVPSVTDARRCKIEFGSIPNLSNSGIFIHKFWVYCDISEKNVSFCSYFVSWYHIYGHFFIPFKCLL